MLNNDKLFLEKDPIFLFKKWMNEAVEKEINDPNAIACPLWMILDSLMFVWYF